MGIVNSCCWCRGWRLLRLRWGWRGIARAASPVFRLSVLCCAAFLRPEHFECTLVALKADSSTCDIAGHIPHTGTELQDQGWGVRRLRAGG